MNAAFVQSVFVESWIAAWNRRDLEAVLAHYTESVQFTSPKAAQIFGKPVIKGKSDLRAYWTRGLDAYPDLQFTLDRWLWDNPRHELAILYTSRLGGTQTRVCEVLSFDESGTVHRSEAFYGAALS